MVAVMSPERLVTNRVRIWPRDGERVNTSRYYYRNHYYSPRNRYGRKQPTPLVTTE